MRRPLHLFRFLAVPLFGFALCCGTAYADIVGTEEAAASLEPAGPDTEREKLRAFVERPER